MKVFRECTNGNVKKAKSKSPKQATKEKKRKEQRKKIVKQEAVEVRLT